MEQRSEIEVEASQAVKSLRSKFEQLAASGSGANNNGNSNNSSGSNNASPAINGESSTPSSSIESSSSAKSLRSKFDQLAVGSSSSSGNGRAGNGMAYQPQLKDAVQTISPTSTGALNAYDSSSSSSSEPTYNQKSLRSKFEQLAAGSSTSSGTSTAGSSGTSSNSSSSIFKGTPAIQAVTPTYTSSLNSNDSASETSNNQSDSAKAAALKRPPPPPPPSRNSKLQNKRSLSPMPSVVTPSPLTRPVPLPPSSLLTGTGEIASALKPVKPLSDKPPVPPRPSTMSTFQYATPEASPVPSDDETAGVVVPDADSERSSRLSAYPPPPRHRASLSPNLQSIDGLPATTCTPPPPPLPTRRSPMQNESPLPRSPPPSRTNSQFRPPPPPSPRLETMGLALTVPDQPVPSPMERRPVGSSKLPPPPTRTVAIGAVPTPVRPVSAESSDEEDEEDRLLDQLPDFSTSSRRPPILSFRPGYPEPRIPYHPHTGCVIAAGPHVVVADEKKLKVYNLEASETLVHSVEMKEFGLKDTKISCMEFRPCANKANRGYLVWMGTEKGSIVEFDIRKGTVTSMKPSAHLHSITYIFRHGRSMVTLDESGKALIFSPDPEHPDIDINLKDSQPRAIRTTDKQEFVKLLDGKLWTSGKLEYHGTSSHGTSRTFPVVRVFDIFSPGNSAKSVLASEHCGKVTSGTIMPSRPDYAYLGHEEGFVSVWNLNTEDGWPKCEEVVKVAGSDVMSLEGVNDKLWAGGRGGMITAYDVSSTPWTVTNSWVAHPGLPVMKLFVNHYAIDMGRRMCVVSLGRDECVRFWDGFLSLDWVDNELIKNEGSFSTFHDITLLMLTFNISASRPDALNTDPGNQEFFNEFFASVDQPPDILTFSFQEVVDLENRRILTKSVFLMTTGKKGDALSDRVTGNYKRWYDRLVLALKTQYGPMGLEYDMVAVESLVGLFSCTFVKKSSPPLMLKDIAMTFVKTGFGGKYGNKGAIISRLVVGDSSFCFVNCHLAAGQHSVRRRHADITTFIENNTLFPSSSNELTYVGGGDGTMILDHEFVLWNGDLNYRIDLRREAALSAIKLGDFALLRAHDQLLREMKTNRGFRLRGFNEGPLNFAPTYKYDPRSHEYDTSEKRRTPSWCDRILWRSRVPGRMKQLHYKRYDDVTVSDHRPVSAAFRVTTKMIQGEARARSKAIVEVAWADESERLLEFARAFYVREALL
ncbi:type I inositol-1,4,5-trisphosphate 5-phosphatase 11 [Coprinopsis cinerea okayama7|uniref:Type I inositol-1,4,5-trisphosphate 5-phosphatase 11 n=1 Tax=Coprinopsis cinerea (strain Okayama-7 / 130 / ATCC MYA-4618 / FGSC 9003) TaxID=240176 RepID=A8P7N3_COPC7|nr:type I inositol-1,4,5-trisphosphate 5-phosphatase 11 [Coprinopsis cinerea okayama7\|eukprot:XP_001839396.2 type I inositol-1,4,5-trisphosphate 5-phosphatase 11 [Coprinopsis cinerea okayama7\